MSSAGQVSGDQLPVQCRFYPICQIFGERGSTFKCGPTSVDKVQRLNDGCAAFHKYPNLLRRRLPERTRGGCGRNVLKNLFTYVSLHQF